MAGRDGVSAGAPAMLSMVGVSHRNAPLTVREQFAIPAEAQPAAREAVASSFGAGASDGDVLMVESEFR